MSDLIERLRRNPVICMDKQNITSDAADEIERLRDEVAELTEDNTTLYNQCEDALVRAEKAEAEIERLRRVEQAAKNMVKWWEDSGLIYNCGPVEELKAALEDNGPD